MLLCFFWMLFDNYLVALTAKCWRDDHVQTGAIREPKAISRKSSSSEGLVRFLRRNGSLHPVQGSRSGLPERRYPAHRRSGRSLLVKTGIHQLSLDECWRICWLGGKHGRKEIDRCELDWFPAGCCRRNGSLTNVRTPLTTMKMAIRVSLLKCLEWFKLRSTGDFSYLSTLVQAFRVVMS